MQQCADGLAGGKQVKIDQLEWRSINDAATAAAALQNGEIDVAVFTFDGAQTLRLVNRAGERILAQPAEQLLGRTAAELGIALVEVPDAEFRSLGCNVLAVRPRVVILAEGNPQTSAALIAAGCQVHTYPATEIGLNGSGGPTCMTRPILRETP